MTSTKSAAIVCVGLSIAMAIVPPIAYGQNTDSWRKTILDFQTLIAGVFAVIAAYATIRQMQFTDEAAQKRHEELVKEARSADIAASERHSELIKLSLRADHLRVDRLLLSNYLDVMRLAAEARSLQRIVDTTTPNRAGLEQIDACDTIFRTLQDVFDTRAWHQAEDLFSAKLHRDLMFLHRAISIKGDARNELAGALVAMEAREEPKEGYSEYMEQDSIGLADALRAQYFQAAEIVGASHRKYLISWSQLPDQLEAVLEGLREMGDAYGIEIPTESKVTQI